MKDNIISFDEGCDLLSKLFSERIPVCTLLLTPAGSRIRVDGFIDSLTHETGIVVSVSRPPSTGSAAFSVPFFDRKCEFFFGDIRDIPDKDRGALAAQFGDTVLCVRFLDSDEFLTVTFKTLASE